MDLLDVSVISAKGYKYILVVCDYFTKYTEAYPLKDKTARSVADALMNIWLPRYGFPLFLHSDQGKEFDNAMIHKLSELLGTVKQKQLPTIRAAMAWWSASTGCWPTTPQSTRPQDSRHIDSFSARSVIFQGIWSTGSCAQTHHQETQAPTLLGCNRPYMSQMMKCARSNNEPLTARSATTTARRWRAHFPLDAGHFGTTPQPERTSYAHHG